MIIGPLLKKIFPTINCKQFKQFQRICKLRYVIPQLSYNVIDTQSFKREVFDTEY